MLRMAVGHSDDVDPDEAIADVVAQCRAALGGLAPKAAVLVSAYEAFQPSMLEALHEAFPRTSIVGATSAAEISSVGGFREDSVTLTMFASDVIDVTIGFGRGLGTDVEAACAEAVRTALEATTLAPKVCVMLAETFAVDPQRTIDAIAARLPPGVVILGGGSARGRLQEMRPTFQFGGTEVSDDAVGILLFSGPVAISVAVGTGWKTVGRRGTVTASREGLVIAIDGQPAVDFVSRYIGAPGLGMAGNPLAVFDGPGGEFYLRTMMPAAAPAGAVMIMGTIPEGAEVQLTTAETAQILDGARASVASALDRFPPGARPEAALVFSCAIRRSLLGSRTRVEADLVRSVLGPDVPVAGLYCFGEIGPVRASGTSHLLNETFVTLLLGT